MSVDELGSFNSNQDITSESNFESSSNRKPSDGANNRFPAPLHLHHRIDLHVLHIAFEHFLRRRKIHAGTERPTRSSYHNDPNQIVGVEALERPRQIDHHRPGQRVQQLRPIDRHEGDAARLTIHEYQPFGR